MSKFKRWLTAWLTEVHLYQQLTRLSSVGLFVLGLAISFFTTHFINVRLEHLARVVLIELTQQLANQSRLIFFESKDLASIHLTETAQFPGVIKMIMFKPDAQLWLASSGNHPEVLPTLKNEWKKQITLAKEDEHSWTFVAPIRVEADSNPLVSDQEPQLLGYLAVVWKKALYLELQEGLFLFNGLISLTLAISTTLIFNALLRRLTQPLDQLLTTIHKLRQGEMGARAPMIGTVETREIARMFNALLDGLERHQRELESLVTVRTQDLRVARDAALTAMRYKSEFMAAVTHEMRLPLQSIIGYTDESQEALLFLAEHTQSRILQDIGHYLSVVRRAADDLLLRINQVLDLAAFESGKRDIQLETVDLPTLLADVVNILNPLIEKNGNQVQVDLQGLKTQLLDLDKIKQIVRNLLDNACKFTHSGVLLLNVESTEKELRIEVTDSGIGLAPSLLEIIFEPFRQADMSNTRRYGGTGLGLAITRSLCELLGGTIQVRSELGIGSTFTVVIPLPILQFT